MLAAFDVGFMVEVTIHQASKVSFTNVIIFTQCIWHDREGVRDAVFRVSKRKFSNGGQRGNCTFLVTTMHWVSTWAKWRTSTATVWGVTGFLTVNHVGSDGQNRLSCYSATVGTQFLNFLHETFYQVTSNIIYARIVVTELWIFAFNFEVDSQAVFVTDGANFGVFDCRQGVSSNGQTCDTTRHSAINITVMQCHQCSFVAVFVMHKVNDVQGSHVLF